ncbi:hypothetical protein FHR24_000138 [Wenyingzhuangia heitensis]|uniref:DUF676 domain-containing protein n=1 Tax=Wenyingzhuangia heitensis TaxID=1487859 RepID=A0ABX0U4A7_9FLAO|nr:alpha/beta hydrolase [Wenyingzhuangia heitensis]NIJ43699.1 hypothetical protein [Wenyingzhuangia heitensis]
MKKTYIIFTILVCLFVYKTQAQEENDYTAQMDGMFQYLDKTAIDTDILIDRVFPAANIQEFNQGVRIDTSSYRHYKQAWSELYRASYHHDFVGLETLKTGLYHKNYDQHIVPIGFINTEFHRTDFGTTEANAKVAFDENEEVFRNIAGLNPFVKKQTTIVSPLVHKVVGSSFSFKMEEACSLYQQGKRIKKLLLTTNGANFTLIDNFIASTQYFNTTYSESGIECLKFTITFSDDTSKITYAVLSVEKLSTAGERADTVAGSLDLETEEIPIWANHGEEDNVLDGDLLYQGYDESRPYEGKNEYKIYYDLIHKDKILNKPMIIIDGYDAADSRKISVEVDGRDGLEKSLYEQMSYDPDNNPETDNTVDMVQKYREQGYDVILVNHPRYKRREDGVEVVAGSDYLQRNAFTFIALLRRLKKRMQPEDKFTIIGPSMGGLVSRYALAYMEKKLAETGDTEKWDHKTALWVSFDSPHQGANIPIGVQKGIQYFANDLGVETAKEFITEQLDKPFPKQLLVNHYTNNSSYVRGAVGFRTRFQNELDALGFPKAEGLRRVALINGSVKGSLNGVSKAKYLGIEDDLTHLSSLDFFIGPLGSFLTNIVADKMKANFFHVTNEKTGISESLIFEGGIRGKFLWWKWWTNRVTYKSRPSRKGSYDVAPGGYFNAQVVLANESNTPNSGFEKKSLSYVFHSLSKYVIDPTHCFIPSKSALAYQKSEVLDEDISGEDLACAGKIPFDAYYAPSDNEQHVSLNEENVNWLTEQLTFDDIAQNDNVYNQLEAEEELYEITGPEYFIGEATYNFGNCFEASEIEWEASSNLSIVNSNSRSITVVTNINPFERSEGYIRAKFRNLVFEKRIIIRKRLMPNVIVDYHNNKINVTIRELKENGMYEPISNETLAYYNSSSGHINIFSYNGNMVASQPWGAGRENIIYMPYSAKNEYMYVAYIELYDFTVVSFIYAPY